MTMPNIEELDQGEPGLTEEEIEELFDEEGKAS